MKLTSFVTLALVLFSTAASADTLGFMFPGTFSIEERREVEFSLADLRITSKRIEAPFGVRREGDDAFATVAPVLIGERYVLRDAEGREHHLRIRTHIDGQVWIDLMPVNTVVAQRR